MARCAVSKKASVSLLLICFHMRTAIHLTVCFMRCSSVLSYKLSVFIRLPYPTDLFNFCRYEPRAAINLQTNAMFKNLRTCELTACIEG